MKPHETAAPERGMETRPAAKPPSAAAGPVARTRLPGRGNTSPSAGLLGGDRLAHPTAAAARSGLARSLQRRVGNAAVQRAVAAKLSTTTPMQSSAQSSDVKQSAGNPMNQSATSAPGFLQAKSLPSKAPNTSTVEQPLPRAMPQSSGRPLDKPVKQQLEQGFNTRLDAVRVHDNTAARAFVRERHAYAVTFGQDIYLGQNVPADNVSHTLAHEVAHTIQQRGASTPGHTAGVAHYQSLEKQADLAADGVLSQQSAHVQPGIAGNMEQADGEQGEPSPEVRSTETVVMFIKEMTEEQRLVLQTHPPTYRSVVRVLIEYDANWVKDKLLETWVDDEDEESVIAALRRWAMTPKLEGGNYLDDFLDELRLYSYYYDYFLSESVKVNMIDKLYAEMEDERYEALLNLIDTFSVRYAGYRGRGDINRWSGLQTAVMPAEVRERLSRINQRLAGRVTLPMTPEEIQRINDLYAQLRRKTLGLIDMPDLQLGPAPGQQAAPALAAPVVTVAAIVYALILAILVTIAIMLIIAIIVEIERALDRAEFSSEPTVEPVPPVAPPIDIPIPDVKPVPPIAPPIAPPVDIPIPDIEPLPNPPPEPEPEPEPEPRPPLGPDIFPPVDIEPRERRRRRQDMDFYHGTDETTGVSLAAGTPVIPIGRGEFGLGFYTFIELPAAELAAEEYTRSRGLPIWGVVDFSMSFEVLLEYGLGSMLISSQESILVFPDNTTSVPVRYPEDMGGIVINMSWKEFIKENERLGKNFPWPYDLIIGPLKGRLPGYRRVDQFVFNNLGVVMLNDPRVNRSLVSSGPT